METETSSLVAAFSRLNSAPSDSENSESDNSDSDNSESDLKCSTPKNILTAIYQAAISAIAACESINSVTQVIYKSCETSHTAYYTALEAAEWTSVAKPTAAATQITSDASASVGNAFSILMSRQDKVARTSVNSFVTSMRLLTNYDRTSKKMQSTKSPTMKENKELMRCYHLVIDAYESVHHNIHLWPDLISEFNAHSINFDNIKRHLDNTMNAVQKACETMVELFVSHSEVCTKAVLASKPEATSLGDKFICFTVSFDEAFLQRKLRKVLEEHGTIINIVKTPGEWNGYHGINDFVPENFAVEFILSTNATSLFKSLVNGMLSAAPVFKTRKNL